ncbi:hypothetical protein FRC02_001518 [Tulasnella sp. 418]|nr:hypothetical protein FRC02_001518 [Tulasnella sp. 418]
MGQSPIDESSPQDRRKSSRSRGKRGKASRSSSRVASGNTSPSSSGASSPSGSVPPADPFAAFRQGHIPPSLKALTSYTQNSSNSSLVYSRSPVVSRDHSRASSREPSRVRESTSSNAYAQFKQGRAPLTLTVTYSPPTSRNQSRAGSRERNGGPEKDRPSRGRSIGTSSWRMASLSGSPAASLHQTTSQSQGPPPSSTLTSFPSIGSLTTAPSLSSVSNGPHTNTSSTSPPPPWARRLSQNHLREERASGDSESPCTSPTPVTPIDGTEERRSRSRGRKRHHEAPRQQRTDAEAFLDSWGSS